MQVKNLLFSFKYAFEGIWHCLKNERNFRIHIIAALTIILISPYYHLIISDMIKLTIVIFLVIITEMINTSLEELVNLITDTYHEKAKVVKDVSAGAVALASLCALIIAGFLFWDIKIITFILNDILFSPMKSIFALLYIIAAILFIFLPKEKSKNV